MYFFVIDNFLFSTFIENATYYTRSIKINKKLGWCLRERLERGNKINVLLCIPI